MPRFRRSKRRFGRRRRGPRSFKRLARAVARSGSEPKKMLIAQSGGNNLAVGDATSRVLTIMNIPSNLVQGTQNDQFLGNSVYLRGVGVKFHIFTTTADITIRWVLFKARQNAVAMLGAGAVYSSTTTTNTGPTQTANTDFRNPPIFDEGTGGGAYLPFVGQGVLSRFDTTNIKVLKVKTYKLHHGKDTDNSHIMKKFFLPIKREFHFIDPENTGLTSSPNHGKYGSYYLTFQAFNASGSGSISSTAIGVIDYRVDLYFRDA